MIKYIKEKIADFIDFITYNPFGIRALYEQIIGTWTYTVFIWKHRLYREWDYSYLYDLIEFKLDRMAEQLRRDDFVTDYLVRYEEIRKALDYLQIYKDIEDTPIVKLLSKFSHCTTLLKIPLCFT